MVDSSLQQHNLENSNPAWWEVSVHVDGELAEAVAEVIARFVPDGVVIQSTGIQQDDSGSAKSTGLLKVCGYIPAGPSADVTYQNLQEALWYLGRIRTIPEPSFVPIYQTNWSDAWKEHYKPIKIGKKLVIQPAWIEQTPAGRIPILIEPGMAFGTGTHPTTQLCLEVLEEYLKPLDSVIDVGCGSGILSIAAFKLGAQSVLGVDVDADALKSAVENAEINSVQHQIEFGLGSITQIFENKFDLNKANIVLVNILAPIIVRLLNEGLKDLVIPGGVLVLSGILEEQLNGENGHVAILEVLRQQEMKVLDQRQIQDWVVLVVQSLG